MAKRQDGKRRVFINSIVLLVAAPFFGWAAAEGPDRAIPASDAILGICVTFATIVVALLALRWSFLPDKS